MHRKKNMLKVSIAGAFSIVVIFYSQTHNIDRVRAHVDSLQLPHSLSLDFRFAKKNSSKHTTHSGADLKCKRQFRVGFFSLYRPAHFSAIILHEIVNCQSEPE